MDAIVNLDPAEAETCISSWAAPGDASASAAR